jgi:hypothetical protein
MHEHKLFAELLTKNGFSVSIMFSKWYVASGTGLGGKCYIWGTKKLEISRAQPPPTCPSNECCPYLKHYARGRIYYRFIGGFKYMSPSWRGLRCLFTAIPVDVLTMIMTPACASHKYSKGDKIPKPVYKELFPKYCFHLEFLTKKNANWPYYEIKTLFLCIGRFGYHQIRLFIWISKM